MQRTSGWTASSQRTTWGSRAMIELTFQVAIFIERFPVAISFPNGYQCRGKPDPHVRTRQYDSQWMRQNDQQPAPQESGMKPAIPGRVERNKPKQQQIG